MAMDKDWGLGTSCATCTALSDLVGGRGEGAGRQELLDREIQAPGALERLDLRDCIDRHTEG